MLSNIAVAKNQAIKMKTHPKNPTLQIEVPLSQRSHKIGAIPKYDHILEDGTVGKNLLINQSKT